MPAEGAAARGQQLGTLARLAHERATAEEIGEWWLELDGQELDGLDSDIVRIARRDWERARRVPDRARRRTPHAHAEGQEIWQAARERMTSRSSRRRSSETWSWRALRALPRRGGRERLRGAAGRL